MNVIRRALAGELLSSSSSSAKKSSFLLIRLHPENNQTFPLQKPSCLYSTATTTTTSPSRSKKQPVGTKTTTFSETQKETPPKQPRNWAEAARQAAVAPPEKAELQKGEEPRKELQKGLNGEEPRKELPRPSEIPWQKKVANAVNLIGRIQIPVQFGAATDGKYWAGTILSQGDVGGAFEDSPFWIPIIFEGDLAHIAACHLKPTDYVHIAGVLSSDPPPFTMKEGQANVQVMVQNVNFVQESSRAKETFTSDNHEESDNFGTSNNVVETKPSGDTAPDPWRDLLQSPENWLDNRDRKLNGSLNPNYPDFKHKSNGTALWINKATPKWALAGLNGSEVDVQLPNLTPKAEIKGTPMSPKTKKESKGDDSWSELVENPNKWWDNRTGKLNPRAPDFVHKDTRAGLWLNCCPPELIPRLPPPKE